ncbi:hypothetical protein ACSBR2_033565 [Camellia fascicularis]
MMQPTLPLPATPTPTTNTGTQKGGQITVLTVPQHEKRPGHSQWRSQNTGQTES